MHINLDRLRAFIIVARTGNLSAAAREMGASQPNIGRQMSALEKEVGLTLFVRHSRGINLTKQGEGFLALCHDIVGRLIQGTDVLREKDADPSGCLKVISEPGMLDGILEKLPKFLEKFPNINFSFPSATDTHQLQIGHSDVALMAQLLNGPDYIQLPLYDMILRVYASPAYIKLHGLPKELEDLKSHRIIIYGGENSEQFNSCLPNEFIENPRHFIVITNRASMSAALVSGSGLGCSEYNQKLIVRNLLVDVFPDMPDKIIPYYFTYHRRLEGSPKIKAFHDFLKEEVINVWQRTDRQ